MDDMDWKAAMDSEIFRNFVISELHKESLAEANKPKPHEIIDAKIDEMNLVLTAMDEFEAQIKKSPALLNKFKNVQAFLLRNPDAHDKIDPKFIQGILMLDLEGK